MKVTLTIFVAVATDNKIFKKNNLFQFKMQTFVFVEHSVTLNTFKTIVMHKTKDNMLI